MAYNRLWLAGVVCFVCFLLFIRPGFTTVQKPPGPFSPERAAFSIQFKTEVTPYRVAGVFVLPKETLPIKAIHTRTRERTLELKAGAGRIVSSEHDSWNWRAPEKTGLCTLKIVDRKTKEAVTLNVFVMVPYERLRGDCINGYRIGAYPPCPPKNGDIYARPRGFIEVTEQNQYTLVSPHFQLRQFVCKQGQGGRQYIVLREKLPIKLEHVLEEVNRRGYRADTFHVMSGYRTPHYNKSIGNVRYSRHVFGDAADIFVDSDQDGQMDDLNHDGVIDYSDALVLKNIVEDLYGEDWYQPFIGGLGAYRKNRAHGPFVHLDVRGFRARW